MRKEDVAPHRGKLRRSRGCLNLWLDQEIESWYQSRISQAISNRLRLQRPPNFQEGSFDHDSKVPRNGGKAWVFSRAMRNCRREWEGDSLEGVWDLMGYIR